MKKLKFICSAILAMAATVSATAGGLLTNTNQNATFLRNPARDASIAIDGVYSNPAGVAFLPQGLHLSVSWQAAFQKRQMDVQNNLFMMNSNNQSNTRKFEGEAIAPVIPSLQAAYVINDKWSLSAQFAVGGGGGKCEFNDGLPMFEEMIGGAAYKTAGTPVPYSLNQNLTGEQYFYGIQLGGTYKIVDNLSVFGGVRGVIASCGYEGAITGIKVNGMGSAEYSALSQQAAGAAQQYAAAAEQYAAAGLAAEAAQAAAAAQQHLAHLAVRRVVDRLDHLVEQVLRPYDVLELEVQEEGRLSVEHAFQAQLHDACAIDVIEVDPSLDEVAGDDDAVALTFGERAALDILCQYPAAIRLLQLVHGAPSFDASSCTVCGGIVNCHISKGSP